MDIYQILQIVAEAFYVLFLPGFLFSYVFFGPKKIDYLERFGLSFALSLSAVPLTVFYTNLLGIKISKQSVVIEILALITIAALMLLIELIFSRIPKKEITTTKYYEKKQISAASKFKSTDSKFIINLHIISSELFQISLVTYLALLLLETVISGFVTFFFNLNWLLIVVVISGILMVATTYNKRRNLLTEIGWHNISQFLKHKKVKEPKTLSKFQLYYAFLLSVGGGLLVYYKTGDLAQVSIIISAVTMVIIFILSILLLSES
jgi:uncharacterized membrane protein